MDDLYVQVNIYGWSLQKLADESVDLSLMLKVAGIDNFAIAEVHSMKSLHLQPDEDVVIEEETFALNEDEHENKPPFCSTPRMSLLTPVPFPPIEASRISANPAKMIEWISRRETLTELVETTTKETRMSEDFERPLERTIGGTTFSTQPNNKLNVVIIEDENEQNASFHSASSSISDESMEMQDLQRARENTENSEQNASFTSGAEEASRNFDTTIQFRDLKTYPSFALNQGMSDEISRRVYDLLTPMQIDSPYQDLFKPLPEPESNLHNEDEDVVMETPENEVSRDEDQDAGSSSDFEVDVGSPSENCDVHSAGITPRAEFLSEICCQFPGCGIRMNWRPKFGKRRLLDHAITHVNEAQFKCHICSLESVTYRTMAYHYKKNHPDFKFKRFEIRSIEKSPETIVSIWQECYSRDIEVVGLMTPSGEGISSKRKHRRKT